jgi:peptide/nickel transport system substrate-binding protein
MKRIALLILIVSLMATPLAAFAQGSADTINLVTFLDTGNFNPLFGYNTLIQRLTWDALYRVDGDTGLSTPGLGMTSWEISGDGRVYTFTISPDAYWSDGVPITTADIRYTLDVISSPDVQNWLYGYLPAELFAMQINDDKVFTVTLDGPNCAFINKLFWFIPIPAHIYGPDPKGVVNHPNDVAGGPSSGPYYITEYSADEFLRMAANPYYRGGEPQIKNVIMRFEGDPAVTNLMLEAGELDFLRMTAAQFDQLSNPEQFTYYAVPNQFGTSLIMNHTDPANPMAAYDEAGNPVEQPPHPVLGDVSVRQAIVMGYDKDAVLTSIREEGAGERLVWMYHPLMAPWASNPDLEPVPFDPEGAAALLDEAGWTDLDGNGVRECHGCAYAEEGTLLAFTITFAPIYAEYESLALIAQDQLGDIGFDVAISQVEYNTLYVDYLSPQTFDAVVLSSGGFPPDPDTVASALNSEFDVPNLYGNYTSVVNPELDALLEAAIMVPSCTIEDRAPYYHQIQQLGVDNVYFADWGFVTYDYLVVNKRIEGFVPTPLGGEGSEYNFIQGWTIAE